MKRYWGHVIAGLSIAVGGVVVATACVHDDQTLFIRSVQAAPQTVVNNQCIYTPDPTQPTLSNGVLDASFTNSYYASPTSTGTSSTTTRGPRRRPWTRPRARPRGGPSWAPRS